MSAVANHFEVVQSCPHTSARTGTLHTPHGFIATPAFVPVATQAAVKSLAPEEVKALGAQMVLSNTYHLYLRPGAAIIAGLGGLHQFMGWDGPIVTDSGGFQVFSLAHLRRLDDDGVLFRSHLDGSEHFLSPELAIAIQQQLGADIIFALDECPPYTADKAEQRRALERTHLWAERCLTARNASAERQDAAPYLYGIVQGGTFAELRRESARAIASLGFDGYGIGGLSLGEPKAQTWEMLEATTTHLPPDKPRHLLGVGSPEDILEGVALGADIFDSALPTRIARNGALFTSAGRLNIKNAQFKDRDAPLEAGCDCYTCRHFSAAYLHHLFKGEELLAYRLATIHNLRFLMRLLEKVRQSLAEGSFPQLKKAFLAGYQPTDEDVRIEQKEKWVRSQRQKGQETI